MCLSFKYTRTTCVRTACEHPRQAPSKLPEDVREPIVNWQRSPPFPIPTRRNVSRGDALRPSKRGSTLAVFDAPAAMLMTKAHRMAILTYLFKEVRASGAFFGPRT